MWHWKLHRSYHHEPYYTLYVIHKQCRFFLIWLKLFYLWSAESFFIGGSGGGCVCCVWFYSKNELIVSSAVRMAVGRSDTMVTWIDKQMKHWRMFSFKQITASVSRWDVFQSTLFKFLHMLSYISLQKNINETCMQRMGEWIFVSCGNLLSV